MRKKEPRVVITFHTTAEAMAADKYCREKKLPGRMIPVPRELSSDCGLAWVAPEGESGELLEAMKSGGLRWDGWHQMEL